jgi:hypothetical protein
MSLRLLAAGTLGLVLLGGCGDERSQEQAPENAAGASPSARAQASPVPVPVEREGQPIATIPYFGELRWYCKIVDGAALLASSFEVPESGATITGHVEDGGRRAFSVDPGETIKTSGRRGSRTRWRLVYRHQPAIRTVTARLRFDLHPRTECRLARVTLTQRERD